MKQPIFIIMLFLAGQVFAQNGLKSDQIAKEIQLLELENNHLILNEYIKEQCDTTSNIPIQNLSRKLVTDFQIKHSNLKELKDKFDKNIKGIDSIKNKDAEYMKYRGNYVASTGAERTKQTVIYWNIYNRLNRDNKKFKELNTNNKPIISKLNYLTLVEMTAEYQEKKEILPTNFIPYPELRRYLDLTKVKENQKKLDILNSLYKKILEKELRTKYNISDSIKTDNMPTGNSIGY